MIYMSNMKILLHEDTFINTGIIENPEDYKSPKIYSSKKEATKFYENIK